MELVRTLKTVSSVAMGLSLLLAGATANADDAPAEGPVAEPIAEPAPKVQTSPLVVAAERSCRGEALGAVLKKIEAGSVNVRTHVTMGTGFVLPGGLIVTDYDLVRRPQGLRVIGTDGNPIEAAVVAVDDVHRIAVLRPAEALPGSPLDLAEQPAAAGSDVVMVSAPDFTVTPLPSPGVVRAFVTREGARFAIDTSTWSHPGAAIVDCAGQVVGIATSSSAISMESVSALLGKVGQQDEYEGPVVDFGSLETGLVMHIEDDDFYAGGQFGLGMLFADRLDLSARVGVLGSAEEKSVLHDVAKIRVSSDLRVGYRANIASMPVPVWLVPSAGAAVMYDWQRETNHQLSIPEPGCITSGAPCALDDHEETVETEKVTPMAVIGLDLRVDVLNLGYSLFINPSDGHVVHQVGIGVATY